jgi:hypothetical protein
MIDSAPSQGADRIVQALQRAVTFIADGQSEDGAWRDFRTQVGVSSFWTTGYVLHALGLLRRAGVAVEPARIDAAADFLTAGFVPHEGWGYNAKVRTDADSTSWALLGLASWRPTVEDGMAATLRRFVGGAGGVRTFVDIAAGTHWQDEHADVTAAALQAMHAVHFPAVEIARTAAALLQARSADGTWNAYWYETPAYGALHATLSLSLSGIRIDCPAQLLSGLPACKTAGTNAFESALQTELALLHQQASSGLVDALLAQQAVDGRWISPPFLRVTEPTLAAPWLCPDQAGALSADQECLFSTATSARALARALGAAA